MVPAAAATSSAGTVPAMPSPHRVTGASTPASGMSLKSQASMSIDTRPMVRVRRPMTAIGVPVEAWRG